MEKKKDPKHDLGKNKKRVLESQNLGHPLESIVEVWNRRNLWRTNRIECGEKWWKSASDSSLNQVQTAKQIDIISIYFILFLYKIILFCLS